MYSHAIGRSTFRLSQRRTHNTISILSKVLVNQWFCNEGMPSPEFPENTLEEIEIFYVKIA